METLSWIAEVALPLLVGLAVLVVFLKVFNWMNRKQVSKWEQAVEDSSKATALQKEILDELKAVRALLEKR